MPGLGAAGSSGGSTGSTGLGSGPKADLSPVKQIGPSSEGAELPSRLELILCRISAVLKAGHNHHKQTHAEVSQVNHTLSEVQNEIGSSIEKVVSSIESAIETGLTKLETNLFNQLADNHNKLKTQITTTLTHLQNEINTSQNQHRDKLTQLEQSIAGQLDLHKASIVKQITDSAIEERDESREDMTKLGECFGADLAQQMNKVFTSLDSHSNNNQLLLDHLQTQVTSGNRTVLDAQQSIVNQVSSLSTANAQVESKLQLLDRLSHVPVTHEVTSLHDQLVEQLVENDKGRWLIYEDLKQKIDHLGGLGGPMDSVLRQQNGLSTAIQQIPDPARALSQIEQETARNATELAALRKDLDALRAEAPAKLAGAVLEVVRDELARYTVIAPSSSAPTASAPPPCPQASPPDRAAMPPRRTASDTSSRTLVGSGPSQGPSRHEPPRSAQLSAEARPPSTVPQQPSLDWPAYAPSLSSEAMAVLDGLSQPGWNGWSGEGERLSGAGFDLAAELFPTQTGNRIEEHATVTNASVGGAMGASPALVPAASPAVPSSDAVAHPAPIEQLVHLAPDQSSSPRPVPKLAPERIQLPSDTPPAVGRDSPLPVLPPSRTSAPSTPARPPLAELPQASSPARSSRSTAKRPSAVLAPNSSSDESQDGQTLAPVARKLRAPRKSAAAAKANGHGAVGGGGGGGKGDGAGGGLVTPASPAPSVVSVATTEGSGSGTKGDEAADVGAGMRTSKLARRTYRAKKRVMRTIPQSDDEAEVVGMAVDRF